jgi:hypothetical protein
MVYLTMEHTVEALFYKPKDRGFDSRKKSLHSSFCLILLAAQ